jgi:hypothetical protein
LSKFIGAYPPDWPDIQERIKAKNFYCCERCGHRHEPQSGYTLTVHHLDNNKSNCADWNLAALCQRCHLHIQGKVEMAQSWMFDHSDWMKPHVEGYYASLLVSGNVKDTF